MSPASADKSAKDRLLDAGVFAPIGFVLRSGATVDELAAAGRKQVAFSRSLGRAVLQGLARSSQRGPHGTSGSYAVIDESGQADAAVDGYGDLTAREIVAIVAQSDRHRVQWIRDQEAGGKNRVTVLRATDQILGQDD